MATDADSGQTVRIDRWLWAARLVKTRPLAAEAAKGGHVAVNGRRVPPGRKVGCGDTVALTLGGVPRTVVVRGTAERRGPASAAATLYEETPESRAERERLAEQHRLAGPRDGAGRPASRGGPRPTKRDRRRLDAGGRGRDGRGG